MDTEVVMDLKWGWGWAVVESVVDLCKCNKLVTERVPVTEVKVRVTEVRARVMVVKVGAMGVKWVK